jgi:hypothetical protein
VVLVLALAAHDVLAKRLYAQAGGPGLADERSGALLMYYGGDVVDLALAVLVCARWYRRSAPRDQASVSGLTGPARVLAPRRQAKGQVAWRSPVTTKSAPPRAVLTRGKRR